MLMGLVMKAKRAFEEALLTAVAVVRMGGSNKCSRSSEITHTHAKTKTWPGELLVKVKLGRKKVSCHRPLSFLVWGTTR